MQASAKGVLFLFLSSGAWAGEPVFEPTEPMLLSAGSPTKDEDPSLLCARDGALFVAWFSDRGGNPDIYLTRTQDGLSWSPPVRVTSHAGGDFYPNLLQDEQGTFHLTWFRWTALFRGHILYNSSADGLTWDPSQEQLVTTTAEVDDWVPSLTARADGTLLVYFVSDARDAVNPTNEIYLAARPAGESAWQAAVPLAEINSPTEHDHLPFAARTGNQLRLMWVRHDTSQATPWLNHKSDLYSSTSTDGFSWTPPVQITSVPGNVVNLFPAIYQGLGAQWSLLWLSTRLGPAKVFEQPVTGLGNGTAGLFENMHLPPGYSHRVVQTRTAGVFLGAWVQGPEGEQEIYYRFYSRQLGSLPPSAWGWPAVLAGTMAGLCLARRRIRARAGR